MAFDFGSIGPRLDALDDFPAGTPRGRALEELVVEIFESLPGVRVAERNLLSGFGEAEIDSTWVNESPEHGLIGFPRDVLMECKSSKDPLNAAGVGYFATQAARRGVKWSLIVSLNGITGKPERSNAAQLEVRRAAEQDTWVMVLVADELRALRSAEHLEAVIGAKHRRQFGTMAAVTLTAEEIANLDPNRRKITFSRGREGLERAIREEEDRVGITITMYFDDHDPSHFHARHASGEAKVEIESLEVMDSTLERRRLRFALAELHGTSCLPTGTEREPVRHCWTSSRSDDRTDARHDRGRARGARRVAGRVRRRTLG